MKKLFSPIRIGTMEVKNRIAMAPMLTNLVELDGMVTDALIGYFETRAKGGAGMIISEVVTVDEVARYSSRKNLMAWDDRFIPGWGRAVDAVHIHGAKLVPQLVHPGPIDQFQPTAPSAIPNFMTKITGLVPRELTIEEIEGVVDDFGQAARRLRESGCDGVEVHMAHGLFMVANFASPIYNKRTDAYGGSFEARLRFPLEIIKNIKEKAGNDFPVIVRLSGEEGIPGGRTIEETQYMACILVEAGVDAIDVSAGFVPDLVFRLVPPMGTPLACNASYASALKEVVNVPVMVVGRINNPVIAEHVLETNKADLVVMGRALLADPELLKKAEAGDLEDIAPCIACNYGCVRSVDRGDSISCTMNPTVGKEKEMAIVPAAKPKTVMVAGGGPGGLEVARVAALRGHRVTLFEKENRLGGQLNEGAVPPFKQELCLASKYLSVQARKAGVKIKTGKQVTPALIEEFKPDVVVVATGGTPVIPSGVLQGIGGGRVVTAWDVLAGKTVVAGNVVILGGGMIGCETAEFVADPPGTPGGTHVTVVEMLEYVAKDMTAFQRTLLLARLRTKAVKIITSAEVKEILDDGVIVARNGQEEAIRGMDSMILAMGTRSVDELSEKIKDSVPEVYVIGDAKAPRKVFEAISEGSAIGRRI